MFSRRTNWNLAPNALTEALSQKRAAGEAILDLTVSNPTECGFRYDRDATLRALSNPASLAYAPHPQGLESARRAVARYYSDRGINVPISDIFLTASTSEAYSFLLNLLCNPADEILVASPSYPLFDFLADLHDVKIARYPCLYDHGWQIDFTALERAVNSRTRAVVIVNPNNPTGHFFRGEQATLLNELCKQHNLAIIADEVFLDFPCEAPQPTTRTPPYSFASNRDALTFTLSGISKLCGLPQMKFAWIVVTGRENPKNQAITRLEAIADVYLSVSTPVQHAVPQFLAQRQQFQAQVTARTRANLAKLDRQLAAAPETTVSRLKVEAGWNVVLRFPATQTDEQFAIELLRRENVLVHPGHFYDFSADGHLVLSLIAAEEVFKEGIRRLLRFAAANS